MFMFMMIILSNLLNAAKLSILCFTYRVNTQRRHYKLMKEGKASCMNEDRVKTLETVGFAWSTGEYCIVNETRR